MTDYSKDLEILNTIPDEEWTAKGKNVFDSDGYLVAETQDIEDARYIANFNPRKEREKLERIGELEALLKVSACPANCIDGAYPDNYGEPVQCQFCYERGELLK